MGVDGFGASAHVILLEAADCFADGGFDLSLTGWVGIATQQGGVDQLLLHSRFLGLRWRIVG